MLIDTVCPTEHYTLYRINIRRSHSNLDYQTCCALDRFLMLALVSRQPRISQNSCRPNHHFLTTFTHALYSIRCMLCLASCQKSISRVIHNTTTRCVFMSCNFTYLSSSSRHRGLSFETANCVLCRGQELYLLSEIRNICFVSPRDPVCLRPSSKRVVGLLVNTSRHIT